MFVRAGHLALRVPDLDASVAHATRVIGLREVERDGDTVYLTSGPEHHTLQLIADGETAVDHMAFEVAGADGLARLRERLDSEGVEILDEPVETGVDDAIRFTSPTGHVYEAYSGMDSGEPHYDATGVRPQLFGHFTTTAEDTAAAREFNERVLGLKTSDVIHTPGGGFVFMRCNALHHSLAIAPGPSGFHHYAWQVQSIADLGRLGDILDTRDIRFVWGPGRHGPGDNIFTYHVDPAGAVVEHYTDMEIVVDDEHRPVIDWPDAPRTMNMWGPLPAEDFLALTIPFAERAKRTVAAG